MSKNFALENLKTYILDKENPVGSDEFILLIAEYIGDKDIMNAADELVSDLYAMLEIYQKYDILSKQYNKLLERYQELLSKTKQLETYNAEEFEVEEE